jgi:hypothetical protein
MLNQKTLRLSVARIPGETSRGLAFRSHELRDAINHTQSHSIPPEKLLADILKRQGRVIMADVSECPPDTIPAHLARLDGWREIVGHLIRHDYAGTPESRLSGAQLAHCFTLADYLAAADITRRQHRAPVFINSRDGELAALNHKMDLLAGMIAAALPENYEMPAAFCQAESEAV